MSTKAITKIENQISTDIQNALELNMNQMVIYSKQSIEDYIILAGRWGLCVADE
jgi:hypothetical protein